MVVPVAVTQQKSSKDKFLPVKLSEEIFVTDICEQLNHLQIVKFLLRTSWKPRYGGEKRKKDRKKEETQNQVNKVTFSSVSSIASSLSFSLPPFLSILSQKVASSSALELPATALLQKTSKASFRAWRKRSQHLKKTR